MASGGWVLETAVRVIAAGSRPTPSAAAAIRARTSANRAEMDDGDEAGDEGGMILSADARILWETAQGLDRAAAGVSPTRPLPPLLFFTDPERTPRPWETAARLPAGAAVVYRHFGAADAEAVALRLRDVTTEHGVALLIGLDAALAETVGADGVHLPERAVSLAHELSAQYPDWLLTGAVHSVAAAEAARGLHALVLSPVFPAGGVSAEKPALGVDALRSAVRAASTPVYALGGINAGNANRLIGSGACGLAGVDAIQRAFGD